MFRLPYTSQLFEEDGQIVAVCPELNVSSFGNTPDAALAALQEAVTLFLEECQRLGTLVTILEEAGYYHEPGSTRWLHREPIQINRLEAAFA
jgi:predicted RNase H-like HicB family nuclease